jgi:hypothetical protein
MRLARSRPTVRGLMYRKLLVCVFAKGLVGVFVLW